MTMTSAEFASFSSETDVAIGQLEDAVEAHAAALSDEEATEEEITDAADLVDVKRRALALLRQRFFHLFRFDVDYVPPLIIAITPQDNADDVAVDAVVTIEFSEPMNQSFLLEDSSNVIRFEDDAGVLIAGVTSITWNEAGTIATIGHAPFNPAYESEITGSNRHHLKIRGTLCPDLAGNSMREDYRQCEGFTIAVEP